MNIVFDEKEHKYFVDGVERPSVTEILRHFGLYGETRWWGETPRTRGRYVHKACQLLDEGKLDWGTVDKRIEPYIRAYQSFVRDMGWKTSENEVRVYNPVLNYAGTLDKLGHFTGSGKRWLVDLKTGGEPHCVGLQTQAYWQACSIAVNSRACLVLRVDATYEWHELTDRRDNTYWLSFANAYNYKKERGLI